MKKLTPEQLCENNTAIDAFQIYASTLRLGNTEYDVLTQEEFFKSLAYFLNENTEEDDPLLEARREFESSQIV